MRARLVCLFAGAIALGTGCGGGNGGTGVEDPVFTSLNVSPSTLSLAVGETKPPLVATPRDQRGDPMAGLPATTFTSSDDTRATVSASGAVTGVSAGTARITASLSHGGVTRTGVSDITVTPSQPPPTSANVAATLSSTFDPENVRISRNGTVTWTWAGLEHNVLFDNVAGRPADIPTRSSGSVARDFPAAGTFPYRCSIHAGMDGTVVVDP